MKRFLLAQIGYLRTCASTWALTNLRTSASTWALTNLCKHLHTCTLTHLRMYLRICALTHSGKYLRKYLLTCAPAQVLAHLRMYTYALAQVVAHLKHLRTGLLYFQIDRYLFFSNGSTFSVPNKTHDLTLRVSVGLKLYPCLRRRPNNKTTLGRRLVFDGITTVHLTIRCST